MDQLRWAEWRERIVVVLGAAALITGLARSDSAMMTVGAGLIGFSPAAKGP